MRIYTKHSIKPLCEKLRAAGKRLVTTNGCYDIIHEGHVAYLEKAASFGDVLIVGINADNSVRRLKGIQRPVVSEDERAEVIGAFRPVDYVLIFEEDTPVEFLEMVRPHVHIKGGDYTHQIVEASTVQKHGGRVEIVPFIPGHSTTDIIKKITGVKS